MSANTLAPSGFQTARRYDGASPNYSTRESFIAYNYGTVIASGDPVYLYTDGTIRLFAKGGTTVHGIFRGCRYLDPNLGRTQWYPKWSAPTLASTTVVYADVDMDPLLTFQAQMSGAAITQTSIGLNVDISSGTSGVPNAAGMSTCALDATPANTATLPFRILRIIPAPAVNRLYNETYDNQWLEVMMNTSDYPTGTRTGQA